MLHKTQGIVFKFVKYRDTSIIANVFTEKFGLQSYIVNGVRSKSAKGKIALFQPLTCLDMVVYHRENSDIERISELKCNYPFQTIPINIYKSSIALFLTEVLHKTIREKHDTEALFMFIQQSVLMLDHLQSGFENFHIQFLLKLSRYLGFGVSDNNEIASLVDDRSEEFRLLLHLNTIPFNEAVAMSSTMRGKILAIIIEFYRLHYANLGEIKSLAVLHEVLH